MIMIEAGLDEIPGGRSIERAIEVSLAMKIKGVLKSGGSKSKDVSSERTDNSVRNAEFGETTQLREVLGSIKAGSDLNSAIEEEFRVENYQQNDLQGRTGEIGIDIRKENHEDFVGETNGGADSNRVQMLRTSPERWTLRDLMILQDEDIDETSRSAIAVDNNQAMNFCLGASRGSDCQPLTEEATTRVAEKLNLEKRDSELESYILHKLSSLQPSFRTLFEPISVAGTSLSGSSDNKVRQDVAAAATKSKWKKKIEDVVAKVYKKRQQQAPDLKAILYETDVKGILKMKWEEEREKSRAKQRTRWLRSWICCPLSNCTRNNLKDWEFRLEEYSFAW